MKVLMKTTFAGPTARASEGQTVDLDDELAAQLIDGGYAEVVNEPTDDQADSGNAELPRGSSEEDQETISQLTMANAELKAENETLRGRVAEKQDELVRLRAHLPVETATEPVAEQATAPQPRRNPPRTPSRNTKQEATS